MFFHIVNFNQVVSLTSLTTLADQDYLVFERLINNFEATFKMIWRQLIWVEKYSKSNIQDVQGEKPFSLPPSETL